MNTKKEKVMSVDEFDLYSYKKSLQNYEYNYIVSIYYKNDDVKSISCDEIEVVKEHGVDVLFLYIDDIILRITTDKISFYKIS